MKEKILDKIKGIMLEMLDPEIVGKIGFDSDLSVDAGVDSIMLVQLVAEIEDTFNIMFNDEDMDVEKLNDVLSLVECVEKYLNNKGDNSLE